MRDRLGPGACAVDVGCFVGGQDPECRSWEPFGGDVDVCVEMREKGLDEVGVEYRGGGSGELAVDEVV